MSRLLISLCNVFPRGLALGVYDFDRDAFQWLDVSLAGDDLRGLTGLTFHDGRYWCLVTSYRQGPSALIALDEKLQAREIYEFAMIHEAHSMIPFDGGLLVADTGGNRLVWVQTPTDATPLREVEYWRYCDEQVDAVHLNSVARFGGKIFVSIFGHRPKDGWKLGMKGQIINATDNEVVCDNQAQPHSLAVHEHELYWLESATGAVHRLAISGSHEVVTRVDGFVRGLAFAEDRLYVAASMARRRSKSMGTPNKPPTKASDYHTWIYRIDRPTGEVQSRKLSSVAAEIYDLVVLPESIHVEVDRAVDPVVQRFWKCEDQNSRLGDQLRLVIWQKIEAMQVLSVSLDEARQQLAALVQDRTALATEFDPIRQRLEDLAALARTATDFPAARD